MHFRFATSEDAAVLALLNQQLIRDEGHGNPMNLSQLTERIAGWLDGEYQAVLFAEDHTAVGYALFRREPEFVYLRQFYVQADRRRKGIGRSAFHWLWQNAWPDALRLRIDVLVDNVVGRQFWRSVGFQEYCVTMEATQPDAVEFGHDTCPPITPADQK